MIETAPHAATNNILAAESRGRTQFRILTFTGRYDPVEDRLRLDSVDAQGGMRVSLIPGQ